MVVCFFAATMPTNGAGFVLSFGDDDKRTVKITPEFKEAALMKSLPLFSEFADKLKLFVPHPLTTNDIIDCQLTPFQKADGEIDTILIVTKQGLILSMTQGVVRDFCWTNSFTAMQSIHGLSNFLGKVTITREQAIQSTRDTIKLTGIQLEDFFAEQEPQVRVPMWGTNTIARYLIEWHDPRGGDNAPTTVKAEINAVTGSVESFYFIPANGLKRPSPKVNVVAPSGHGMFDSMIPPPMNPDYAWKLIPMMFTAIDEYAEKLSLPIPHPLTTNNVARVEAYNNDGWPHCEIWLTNGWWFVYRHTMVNGFYSSDTFFDSEKRKIHIKDFDGKWRLTTNQAIAIVSNAMTKLNYPTNNIHMDFAPSVYTASIAREHIPRVRLEWDFTANDDLQSRVEAEVNMDNGKLESLYYDDKAYWGSRPPIDIPISVQK